jgi:hypothetical protein
LTKQCSLCGAFKWHNESAGFCCLNGKIKLLALNDPPEILLNLLHGQHAKSGVFFKTIRHLNASFAMTSIGCNEICDYNYMTTFKIHGQL